MEYEIITLEEKRIAGLNAQTGNNDPRMGETIGGLWKKLFEENIFFDMKDKVNENTIGLYTDYGSEKMENYEVTVGCEVSTFHEIIPGLVKKQIPAGRYAKFTVFGDPVEAVKEAWPAIWAAPLERSFQADFEEYMGISENGECQINIYIGIL